MNYLDYGIIQIKFTIKEIFKTKNCVCSGSISQPNALRGGYGHVTQFNNL